MPLSICPTTMAKPQPNPVENAQAVRQAVSRYFTYARYADPSYLTHTLTVTAHELVISKQEYAAVIISAM